MKQGNVAIILIDVQRFFWVPQFENLYDVKFESNVSKLVELCRDQSIELIHIREVVDNKWMPNWILRNKAICLRGTPEAEVLPFAKELSSEKVFEKCTFDAFISTEIETYLKQKQIRLLYFAGLATSVCILINAASAYQRGFFVRVIEDCCADYTESHFNCLRRYEGWMWDKVKLDYLLETIAQDLSKLSVVFDKARL